MNPTFIYLGEKEIAPGVSAQSWVQIIDHKMEGADLKNMTDCFIFLAQKGKIKQNQHVVIYVCDTSVDDENGEWRALVMTPAHFQIPAMSDNKVTENLPIILREQDSKSDTVVLADGKAAYLTNVDIGKIIPAEQVVDILLKKIVKKTVAINLPQASPAPPPPPDQGKEV